MDNIAAEAKSSDVEVQELIDYLHVKLPELMTIQEYGANNTPFDFFDFLQGAEKAASKISSEDHQLVFMIKTAEFCKRP